MSNLEKKVYNGWAFTEYEMEKRDINYQIYKELKEKYRVYRSDLTWVPDVNVEEYDIVVGREPKYKYSEYHIVKNDTDLTTDELLLICDGGNLCFGGSLISSKILRVSED